MLINKESDGLVIKGIPDKLPPGAILLSEFEAGQKQWDIISSYTPSTDIWALRFGHAVLSTAVGFTSILITSYYRSRFKLGSFGKFTTQIPTVFVPSFLSSVLQIKYVTTPILLQNECPVCIQTRSIVIQSLCGIAIPGILAPLASFGYAYNYGSYQLPRVALSNAREYFNIYWKFTRRYQTTLAVMLALNALLATYVTYKGGSMFYQMHLKLLTERAGIEKAVYGSTSAEISNQIEKIKIDDKTTDDKQVQAK